MFDIHALLDDVEKPARYTGGEWGSVIKDPAFVDIRFAFCFPDVYEVGMSHLGMKILYGILNQREDTYCERVFAPWVDMEEKMRKTGVPLFSLETKEPIKNFDMIGFTLQYEMSYTNIINMLDLAGIPILSKDREDIFVVGGGPCAYNPEPLADVFDFFVLGEGEEVLNEILNVYAGWKKQGRSRVEFLEEIARIEGVYVPQFYDVVYNEDGTVKEVTPNNKHAKATVKKCIIKNMDEVYYPTKLIVPYMEVIHDRMMLELFRGCIRGCRFCQAGIIYRPVRERSKEKLIDFAKELIKNTGYEELSLTSLSSSDYTFLESLCNELIAITEPQNINLALPSLRIDNFSLDIMNKVQKVRKSSITFAPEAGTQRLRDVINKNISEEEIISGTRLAFEGGYSSVKLYFMMGLPTETDEDIAGIADLANLIADQYYEVPKERRQGGLSITVSTSCFVPKPHTPFQWAAQDSLENLERKQNLLKTQIRRRSIKYNWHEASVSYLEGAFSRGDRRLAKVLIAAQKKGCKFDSWREFYNFDKWMDSFSECGIDPNFYTARERSCDEVLPWDHINVGVTKKFLINENERAKKGITTPHCREQCSGCGVASFGGGVCHE
ncbi:MAG: TIGR03960 family B12-binding radical SAM protein [Eubacteriales bacterium]|nr:TIGR03960 family B12-binding radical SAM protein [Eubacteriales bacterium]